MAHVKNNSGNMEWYTPKIYIESARKVMGTIDVDPASSREANKIVLSSSYYTKDNSFLESTLPIEGNVWMNPPYKRGLIEKFVDKVILSFKEGEIDQAIILTNNGTETKWGQRLLRNCDAVCFPSKRIRFLDESLQEANSPLQAQMFTYFGENIDSFRDEFSQYGVVIFN